MFEMMLGMRLVAPLPVVGKQVILSPPAAGQKVPVKNSATTQDIDQAGIYFCLGNTSDNTPVRNLWYYQFSSNQWFDLGEVPTELTGSYGVMGRIGNKVYWVSRALVFSFDVVTKLWTRHNDISDTTLRGYGQTAFIWNAELYVYGENQTSTGVYLKKYSPTMDTWYVVSTPPEISRSLYSGGVVVGDVAYFFSSVQANRMVTYNLLTKAWRVVALTWAMVSFPVVVYLDGFIYISTGVSDGSVWRYEISTDTFSPMPKLSSPRDLARGGLYDNKMYIWGANTAGVNQRTMLTYQL